MSVADMTAVKDPLRSKPCNLFFGCYLLQSRARTYVGFTVHPERRLRQHNGAIKGGARTTSRATEPWDMVLVVYGFPSKTAALRFEWAWQNPHRSRHLRHQAVTKAFKGGRNEKTVTKKLQAVAYMLRSPPWNRLPLTLHFIDHTLAEEFRAFNLTPPVHMPYGYGPLSAPDFKGVHGLLFVEQRGDESGLPADWAGQACNGAVYGDEGEKLEGEGEEDEPAVHLKGHSNSDRLLSEGSDSGDEGGCETAGDDGTSRPNQSLLHRWVQRGIPWGAVNGCCY